MSPILLWRLPLGFSYILWNTVTSRLNSVSCFESTQNRVCPIIRHVLERRNTTLSIMLSESEPSALSDSVFSERIGDHAPFLTPELRWTKKRTSSASDSYKQFVIWTKCSQTNNATLMSERVSCSGQWPVRCTAASGGQISIQALICFVACGVQSNIYAFTLIKI